MGSKRRLKRFICDVLTWNHVHGEKSKSKTENETQRERESERRGGKLIQVILIICDAHNSFARAQR